MDNKALCWEPGFIVKIVDKDLKSGFGLPCASQVNTVDSPILADCWPCVNFGALGATPDNGSATQDLQELTLIILSLNIQGALTNVGTREDSYKDLKIGG